MCGFLYKSNFYNDTNIERFKNSVNALSNDYENTSHIVLNNHSFGYIEDNLTYFKSNNNKSILLDGLIYNIDQVKELLSVDSMDKEEVLVNLLINFKESILPKLNGMYSIIYIDNDEVLIVRDLFGIKPLYYSFIDKDIIVSSRIKSIIEYTDNRIIDETGLCELIGMGPSNSIGKTIYKGIYELPPGNLIRFNKDKFEVIELKITEGDFKSQ